LSAKGEAAMVDVAGKAVTLRSARVKGSVRVSPACAAKLTTETIAEIARTARIAAIQAAKQTHLLIPLCHQIALTGVDVAVTFDPDEAAFAVATGTRTQAQTGVEMEALCAATIAGATIYDMIKAVDPLAVVGPFQLVEKRGGKSEVNA
jgi:cyclic pyranopterin phosphate synthase